MKEYKIKIRVIKKVSVKKNAAQKAAPTFNMRFFTTKLTILTLILGLNFIGLSAITGTTLGFFNDTEPSAGNAFTAGSLDFSFTGGGLDDWISLAEKIVYNAVLVNSGTLDFQYTAEAEKIDGSEDFCNSLKLEAGLNGIEKYDGDLMSFSAPADAELGSWAFEVKFPVYDDNIAHGENCRADLVFKGFQTNTPSFEDSGFTDEERISFDLTARMVVLNEFLPRPDGVAYGFDFGNDSSDMPQGEWVELYNNSNQSVDLSGWYVWDASKGEGNKIYITSDNTSPASTVISGKGWLVVYMNKPVLNNTGDTVRLFDNEDKLVDLHAYENNDFCEIEPTPGDENSTDASGECGGGPPNKSYARIPDGIGQWVDPIPTPGRANTIEINGGETVYGAGSIGLEETIIMDEENPLTENEAERYIVEENIIIEETSVSGEIINEDAGEEQAPEDIEEDIAGEEIFFAEETGGDGTADDGAPINEEEAAVEEDIAVEEELMREIEEEIIEEEPAKIEEEPAAGEQIEESKEPEPTSESDDAGTGEELISESINIEDNE